MFVFYIILYFHKRNLEEKNQTGLLHEIQHSGYSSILPIHSVHFCIFKFLANDRIKIYGLIIIYFYITYRHLSLYYHLHCILRSLFSYFITSLYSIVYLVSLLCYGIIWFIHIIVHHIVQFYAREEVRNVPRQPLRHCESINYRATMHQLQKFLHSVALRKINDCITYELFYE